MGRKSDIVIREIFKFESDENVSKCKLCGRCFKGNYFTNLRRHLQEVHPGEYKNAIDEQDPDEPKEKKTKISIALSALEVKEACVQLVTEEKAPFALLDSAPFKKLTEQIFSGLDMNPISSRNVMHHVSDKYELEKRNLSKVLKNKILSLKIDIASRHNKGILGVNVQYYRDHRIEVKTLGLIELHKKHSGLNLSVEIESILEEFSVSKSQIYTVTSDNGKNVVKAIEYLNKDLDNEPIDDFDDDELLKDVRVHSIVSIRCAAHSMQLAVHDFLKDANRRIIVDSARAILKTLRTPTFR